MNILQHMNQLNSSCYGRFLFSDFDNPTEGAVAAEFGVSHSHNMDQLPCVKEPDDEYVHRQSPGFDLQNDMEMDDIPLGRPNDPGIAGVGPEQLRPERFVETFKGCGVIFPSGRTFMDQFKEDQFAEQRRENIYYPWASKQEWAFALWLLRSQLSMVAIDNLLSLNIVSSRVSLCPIF